MFGMFLGSAIKHVAGCNAPYKSIQVRIKMGRMEILSDLPLIVQSSLFSEGTISWKETPPTSFENTA